MTLTDTVRYVLVGSFVLVLLGIRGFPMGRFARCAFGGRACLVVRSHVGRSVAVVLFVACSGVWSAACRINRF